MASFSRYSPVVVQIPPALSEDYSDEETNQPVVSHKRRRMSEDERVKRCRERNRIHARNTRERKKLLLDSLQARAQQLVEEKMKLQKATTADTSIASILMSLAGCESNLEEPETLENVDFERIRSKIHVDVSDDEESNIPLSLLTKDRSLCTVNELEAIRRERNRLHAKKTRLRKKKLLNEMEMIVSKLEEEVERLRSQVSSSHKDASNTSEETNTQIKLESNDTGTTSEDNTESDASSIH